RDQRVRRRTCGGARGPNTPARERASCRQADAAQKGRRVRTNDTRFGIFGFLIATALVLVAIVMFARYPTILRTGREYRAVFQSVAGLNRGDEVRYGGLLVGSVTD